jgi:hypothetical protein
LEELQEKESIVGDINNIIKILEKKENFIKDILLLQKLIIKINTNTLVLDLNSKTYTLLSKINKSLVISFFNLYGIKID